MGHLHTEPGQHDYTVGAYIIRLDESEPRALLHMHKKMGKLLPIGGHIELDETPWQAVAREIREESGYLLSQTKILQPTERITSLSDVIAHPQPVVVTDQDVSTEHSHTDLAYAFTVQGEPAGTADEGESSDLRWLTKHELDNVRDEEIFPNTREIYSFIFEKCLTKWETIEPDQYAI